MYIRFPAVMLSLAGVFVALAASSTLALVIFEGTLVALCLLDAILAPSPGKLDISREAPESARATETAKFEITVRNNGRRLMSGAIRDAWPPSAGVAPNRHAFTLAPGKNTLLSGTITPTRRGTRKSEHATVRTIGPLRLAGRQNSRATEWELRVLPAFNSRKHLPSRVMRLRELEGRALLMVRGQGTEFDSLREYVAGDDVRAIDWRSTARLGNTVVRTWRPERDRRVVIIADAGRGGSLRIGDAPAFDAYIETSLLMTALASKAGDRVHVVSLDSAVRMQVADAKGMPIINRLGEEFADVEPTLAATDWPLAASIINELSHQPALVIVLTTLGLSAISDGLLDMLSQLSRRHTVLVGSVQRERGLGEASTTPAAQHSAVATAYPKAAAARAALEIAGVKRTIAGLGATVVATSAENLPPAIADAYIELKAAGKL